MIKSSMSLGFAVCAFLLCAFVGSASAETTPGTGWWAYTSAYPSDLAPGSNGILGVNIKNMGAEPSSGPITVTDTLPAGVSATKAGGTEESGGREILSPQQEEKVGEVGRPAGTRWVCTGNGSGERDIDGATVITCTSNPRVLPHVPYGAGGNFREFVNVGIAVSVGAGAASGAFANQVSVSGGGAAEATSVSDPLTVSSSLPGFGFSGWDVWFSSADGQPDTQAGSHPYDSIFAFTFNQLASNEPPLAFKRMAGGEVRTLEVELPPGFFGFPHATPECTRAQLDGEDCPAASQVGNDQVGLESENAQGGVPMGPAMIREPVFNMVPPPGVAAEFAFSVAGLHAIIEAGVRSAHGYRIVTRIRNIPQLAIAQNIITFWGVPAEAVHDPERKTENPPVCEEEGCPGSNIAAPLFTLPTECAGPQSVTVRGVGTWQDPNVTAETEVLTHAATAAPTGFTGCEGLSIEPSLTTVPDTAFADTPAGLTAEVKVPQENLVIPEGLVASTLKNTSVTLPEGVVINPGQATGLAACGPVEANIENEGPQSCPAASKVWDRQDTDAVAGRRARKRTGRQRICAAVRAT